MILTEHLTHIHTHVCVRSRPHTDHSPSLLRDKPEIDGLNLTTSFSPLQNVSFIVNLFFKKSSDLKTDHTLIDILGNSTFLLHILVPLEPFFLCFLQISYFTLTSTIHLLSFHSNLSMQPKTVTYRNLRSKFSFIVVLYRILVKITLLINYIITHHSKSPLTTKHPRSTGKSRSMK